MFQWSNTAQQTHSNLVASQSNHFVILMVCVAHVCDTMSELEVGNFEAESDAQMAGLFFGSFVLTCLITGPGGIEGQAQLWLTGIHTRDLSMSFGLLTAWQLVPRGDGLRRTTYLERAFPETKAGAVGLFLNWPLKSWGVILLHFIDYKRVPKASPDLRGRGF